MEGLVYNIQDHWNENGDMRCAIKYICIDKTIHISENLCEEDSFWVLGKCDGTCAQSTVELPLDVEVAIRESIAAEDFRPKKMIYTSWNELQTETDFMLRRDSTAIQDATDRGNVFDPSRVTIGDLLNFKAEQELQRACR